MQSDLFSVDPPKPRPEGQRDSNLQRRAIKNHAVKAKAKQNFFPDDDARVVPAAIITKPKASEPELAASTTKPKHVAAAPTHLDTEPELNTNPKASEGWIVEETSSSASRADASERLSFRFRATQAPPSLLGMVVFGTAPRVMTSVDGKKNVVSPASASSPDPSSPDPSGDAVTPVKEKQQSPEAGVDLSDLIDQYVPTLRVVCTKPDR